MLSLACVILQQVPVPYVFTLHGVSEDASLAHLHFGLLLLVAMLNRDLRVLAACMLAVYVSWALRMLYFGNSLWASAPRSLVLVCFDFAWTVLCAHWMGWPKPTREPRIELGDLPRLAVVALLVYPAGLAGLDWLLAWSQGVPDATGNALQALFAKLFGVLIVCVPMLGAWTERMRPAAYRGTSPTQGVGRWFWLLSLLLFFVLSLTVAWQVGHANGGSPHGQMLVADFRYAMFALLAWAMLYMRPRNAFVLLMLSMFALAMVVSRTGETIGAPLGFANMLSMAFEASLLMLALAYLFVVNRDSVQQRARLSEEARRDAATGLPNLVVFREDAAHACGGGGCDVGYLFIDSSEEWIAGFGMDVQAAVQRQIVARLEGLARAYVASSGQFALLAGGSATPGVWARAMKRIESIEVNVAGQRLRLSPYVGVAHAVDGSQLSLDAALLAASQLAFDARRRNEVRPLIADRDASASRAMRTRLQEAGEVLECIRARRIELYFQQIVPAHPMPGTPLYGEVLCRLRSLDGRLLVPGEFMAAVEGAGRTAELDLNVWRELFELLRANRDVAQQLRLSVNLGGASLASASFLVAFERMLDAMPVAAERLCIEITESAAIARPVDAKTVLDRIRARGCNIAIDDFGSGMQSFSRLRALPVDVLKIDGSFVRGISDDPRDRALVRACVQVAQAFNAETVAEYVETEADAQALRELGVGWLQGYLFGEPRPLRDVLSGLRVWS